VNFIYALESELYELYTQEVPQKHMQRGEIGPEMQLLQKENLMLFFFSFAISDQRKFSSNNPHPHIYPSYVPTLAYFTDFLTCCQICSSKAKHTIMHHLPLPFYFSLLPIIDLLSAIAR
jgi:hypothetical protein